jgi:DNA-binding GntR family transcriptional regulator
VERDVETQLAVLRRGDDTTLRELMFQQLRREIISGAFQRGERLVEEELAEQYKVSRTPVREALRKLELEGLVQYLPRRGVVVTGLSSEDMDEVYATREVLQGLAARLAAEHATDDEIARLRGLIAEMNEAWAQGDLTAAAATHTRFNELLCEAGRNKRLRRILAQFSEYTEHAQLRSMEDPGRAAEIRTEHEMMLRAIASRDPVASELTARLHVAHARRAFFERLQDARRDAAVAAGHD